ncbi:aspartate/glutamate racemase family protein [Paracoccus sp. Z330]|uniref:Aspartate/glutamate racemase family protein n=1 Tax=Paracoccus onchidii TaxID=3017813 RepID=A0ABT4ZAP1_9RHOB|nr:aspartate/glutamate racemase family protein [Paracoccus onchidii]MDB6176207.1 aspartate/glutamate racemase family protein [Paracoccus onchidii]
MTDPHAPDARNPDSVPCQPRLALVHATRLAMDPVEAAARSLWPEAETVSLLEEALSVDRRKSAALSSELMDRILWLARYAEDAGADGVLFTCSAFGAAIDLAAERGGVPVMKPNEAMFCEALGHGNRIAMICTFAPAVPGMTAEFHETAFARGGSARVTTHVVEGALEAKLRGDSGLHDQLIAQMAASIKGVDAIMLAQFSMSGAADAVRAATDLPVLTSPQSAIIEMRRRIETQGGGGRC